VHIARCIDSMNALLEKVLTGALSLQRCIQ
jgi:hypothetical protein